MQSAILSVRSFALKHVLVLMLLLLGSNVAAAQQGSSTRVVGQVLDGGSSEPISTVQVTLRSGPDSVVVGGALTDASGRFVISNLPTGEYEASFQRLGYMVATRTITMSDAAAEPVDLGTIALLPAAVALEGVDVIAEQPEVVQTADRDVYRADAIPGAAGGSATDLLQGVPDLETNINGEVSLYGQAPAIYINGREAPMTGESLTLFLEQFAAENIQSIEVIPNPSARYNAEGAGGIVNIVLKEDVGLGLSGNAFINGGTRGQFGTGGRATYERGPLTFNGGGSLRLSSDHRTTSELRQNLLVDPMTFLEQNGWSDRSSWSGNVNLRTDYELTKATTLRSDVRVRRNVSEAERSTRYTEMDSDRNPTEVYDRLSLDDGSGNAVNLALQLDHEFGGGNQEREFWERGDRLQIEVEYDRGRDWRRNMIERHLLEEIGAIDYATELTEVDESQTESEVEFSIDYSRSIGESSEVEVGYSGEVGWTDENRLQEIRFTGLPEPEEITERGFLHRQTVHSGYLSLMRSFGAFSAQLGARAEHADNRLELPGDEEVYGRGYYDFFPSANLTYNFDRGRRIRFSYSMRVRRPASRVLNPINTSSDPLHIRIGNPDIEPQYTHSYTINANWSGDLGYIRATPFLRRSVNQWEQLRTVDENGIATTTYDNLGSTNSYGVSLTGSLRDFHGFRPRVSINGQHTRRNFSERIDRETPPSTRWSVRGNLDREIGDLRLQTSLVYNPARDLPQGRQSSTTMTRVGARYRFLDRRASLNIDVTDPFDIYDSSIQRSASSYVEIGNERVSMRRVTMSLSYSFQGGATARGGGGPRGR